MVQLHRKKHEFEAKGARIVAIGNGPTSAIEAFREKSGFHGEIYTDPTLQAFEALSLNRGVFTSFNFSSIAAAFGAYKQGFRQGSVKGDPWQQGGVFVVDSEGTVRFAYKSRFAGDHPAMEQLLTALD